MAPAAHPRAAANDAITEWSESDAAFQPGVVAHPVIFCGLGVALCTSNGTALLDRARVPVDVDQFDASDVLEEYGAVREVGIGDHCSVLALLQVPRFVDFQS